MLNLIKSRIKENKEIKVKKKYLKNLSLISSVMLRKLRLSQKKWFSYKKTYIIETGVSDYHKFPGTFFKSHFNRLSSKTVYYSNCRNYDQTLNWNQMTPIKTIVSEEKPLLK